MRNGTTPAVEVVKDGVAKGATTVLKAEMNVMRDELNIEVPEFCCPSEQLSAQSLLYDVILRAIVRASEKYKQVRYPNAKPQT